LSANAFIRAIRAIRGHDLLALVLCLGFGAYCFSSLLGFGVWDLGFAAFGSVHGLK
jgi:hypothetical protein